MTVLFFNFLHLKKEPKHLADFHKTLTLHVELISFCQNLKYFYYGY